MALDWLYPPNWYLLDFRHGMPDDRAMLSRDRAIYQKNRTTSDLQSNANKKGRLGGGLDRPKMMVYGQLRFWAAGKLAYESEVWPQAPFFVLTSFSRKNNHNSRF